MVDGDIFSFDGALSELDKYKLLFVDVRDASGDKLMDVALLQLLSTGDAQPRFSESCPDAVRSLTSRCLALRPSDRPSAVQVSYELRSVLHQRIRFSTRRER